MRILFTGASSFTGYWFVQELGRRGHEVTAIFRSSRESYEGVRARRVEGLRNSCRSVWECSFGDDRFLDLAGSGGWDLLCHHAAEVGNYRSPEFYVAGALASNTRNLARVLELLKARGCQGVLLTGTVFEEGEGAGSEGLPAFSPYGLSKCLTARFVRYYCGAAGLPFAKFVVPNPFGPFEEPRFCSYLIRTWYGGEAPVVRTPLYVRDNIHVSLLANAYRSFAEATPGGSRERRLNPAGYVEPQGTFARRLAAEMSPRLGIPCPVELAAQTDWSEPRVRLNTDVPDAEALDWSEKDAWDDLAEYYRKTYGPAEGRG